MIVVLGSINIDLITRVDRLPQPGETLSGLGFDCQPGGKGANQALAAARAGAPVRLFGAVGRDAFADSALANLRRAGIDLDGVARVDGPTGCATILVDARGENSIVVVAGANAAVTGAAVPDDAIDASTLLVLQQEIPAAANAAMARRVRGAGGRCMLNAAPVRTMNLSLFDDIDILVVNESEAAALAPMFSWSGDSQAFATQLVAAFPRLCVVLTLGARGARWIDRERRFAALPPPVDVVDTTGAGDAFVGALAASLHQRMAPGVALARAVAAGAGACRGPGAQGPTPAAREIEELCASVRVDAI
jgi:ribokinase